MAQGYWVGLALEEESEFVMSMSICSEIEKIPEALDALGITDIRARQSMDYIMWGSIDEDVIYALKEERKTLLEEG